MCLLLLDQHDNGKCVRCNECHGCTRCRECIECVLCVECVRCRNCVDCVDCEGLVDKVGWRHNHPPLEVADIESVHR